ncbi:TonB-dependent receptor [Aquimarina sp. ERC-38]|uniref:TonB-dependent receptor n=1 Tax=Aquimarina sp. ERC-38 TaxID=2949996 RepID=UPI0022450A24|nr:TonB-dependent receptor [Aquimarina sp. ERC-38]UZO82050.1 TonB-dependent receptor [Aquimarina sp. ERC-38]
MRIFYLVIFLIFFIFKGTSQQITVLGFDDRQPIPGVAIFTLNKGKSTITDFDGKANLHMFKDSDIIYFSHVSFLQKNVLKSDILSQGGLVYLSPDSNQLSEVLISVAKWKQDKKDISQKVVSISSEEAQLSTPQTTADVLQNSGQVFIQKSQLGGGSPIIRGFSTNRLLITVDGVRMNTAIFRGGNVQNIISIDPFSIARTEVILGPGSVVYGSDAIGGVMNFYTKQPAFKIKGKNAISGEAILRYASASNEKTGHVNVNYGRDQWAFLTSVSYSDFDDLKMGSQGPEEYIRNRFVVSNNGTDQLVDNNNPNLQVGTGYSQINFLQKIKYTPNENWDYNLGLTYTTTSDVPRYDRLIRPQGDSLRSAEWFYGPQEWGVANLQINYKKPSKFFDRFKITTAYQLFKESRNDRDFGSVILERTKEKVDAYSINLDWSKDLGKKTNVYYGLEYILNKVNSEGSILQIDTRLEQPAQSRYPDGATWQSVAGYASVKHSWNKYLRFQGGLRYNRVVLRSQFDNRFINFEFTEKNLDTDALTGTAGLSYLPNDYLQFKVNFSTAFRAPNIDDVGKIFDSEPGSVVVPNKDLKSERAYNGDIGFILTPSKKFSFDATLFYTMLDDALVRRNFTFNGQSMIEFGENNELSQVQAIQNAAKATIFGFETGFSLDFLKNATLTSRYTYTGGSEELDDGSIAPVRHVAPQFGTTNLTYTKDKWLFTVNSLYNGKFTFKELAPSERNKAYLYAIDGQGNPYSPSWYTLNIRSQYQFTKKLQGTFSVENLTDQRYRPYSSGIAGPGLNFIMAVRYTL